MCSHKRRNNNKEASSERSSNSNRKRNKLFFLFVSFPCRSLPLSFHCSFSLSRSPFFLPFLAFRCNFFPHLSSPSLGSVSSFFFFLSFHPRSTVAHFRSSSSLFFYFIFLSTALSLPLLLSLSSAIVYKLAFLSLSSCTQLQLVSFQKAKRLERGAM